ncbi:right-handed parallel beta-helix repeat-containing protein [Macrococcoides caseolyticum]|uniref:right-handed parallel beta-helix repeat-containing protein n=1 Tax=Macrococcoides caseolyticum TaxID=69966 RepID=UPI002A23FBDA|nr:right-handed parallel beta-helix repeat-containing protein [Macrococcus caseolyticus]
MLINSIKTRDTYHNYIVIKQGDMTSKIELMLCGSNGELLKDLTDSCIITIADGKEIRQKINGGILNGILEFNITQQLSNTTHSLEITTNGGVKFPAGNDFYIKVTDSLAELELNIIKNMTKDEAYRQLTEKFIGETLDLRIDEINSSEQKDLEVINARKSYPTLGQRLNVLSEGIGVSIKDFPRLDEETDDKNRFQRAIDYLQSIGGGKLVVPPKNDGYEFIMPLGTTVDNPYRVLITGQNIVIEGVGLPLIKMKGLSKGYLETLNDRSSSGRDVFTIFSFIGAKDCFVRGFKFLGEWDGKGTFRYESPRAKAIGFTGCYNCHADEVHGEGIMGNVVNANNSMPEVEGHYKWSENISITSSSATRCLENGFNFMGGTRDGKFTNNLSTLNGTCGFEAATENLTVTGNILRNNKLTGMSFSGLNAVITGNVFKDNNNNGELTEQHPAYNLLISGQGDVSIISNKFSGSEGCEILVFPGIHDLIIKNNDFKHKEYSKANYIVYVSGTSDMTIDNVDIIDNKFDNKSESIIYAIMLNYVKTASIIDNSIKARFGKYAILVQESCSDVIVKDNLADKNIVNLSKGESYTFDNFGERIIKRITSNSKPTLGYWMRGDIIDNDAYNIDEGHPDRWRCIREGYANENPFKAQTNYEKDTLINASDYIYKAMNSGKSGDIPPYHGSGEMNPQGSITWLHIGKHARFEVASQVGLYPVITNKPMFIGQIAKTSAGVVYIAIGTSSTNDWKQITN